MVTVNANNMLLPGTVFQGRYRVVRAIKAGSMGAVYEIVDHKTESRRALKVMLPGLVGDPDLRARFVQEAKITGGIESDHIVRVLDADVDGPSGTPFLVLELLRGEELGRVVKRAGPLPHADIGSFVYQAALALDRTHAAGIVHRDLKPQNLFLTYRDDGSPCIKILDFGIAKVFAQQDAHATKAIGTPLYMAPEQIRGDVALGPPVDIYALGQIAYTLLTAEPYWNEELKSHGTVYPLLSRIVEGVREPPSARAARRNGIELPPGFDAWFLKATASRPEHRFGRATEAATELSEVLGGPSYRAPTSRSWTGTAYAPQSAPQSDQPPRGAGSGVSVESGSAARSIAAGQQAGLASASTPRSVAFAGATKVAAGTPPRTVPLSPEHAASSAPVGEPGMGSDRGGPTGVGPRVEMSMAASATNAPARRRASAFWAISGVIAAGAVIATAIVVFVRPSSSRGSAAAPAQAGSAPAVSAGYVEPSPRLEGAAAPVPAPASATAPEPAVAPPEPASPRAAAAPSASASKEDREGRKRPPSAPASTTRSTKRSIY